jgi:hypothetical protein
MATRKQTLRVQILQMLQVLVPVLADASAVRFVLMLWLATLADICQAVLRGLARLADIRQAVLCGLARLAKGKFGECYANLASPAKV